MYLLYFHWTFLFSRYILIPLYSGIGSPRIFPVIVYPIFGKISEIGIGFPEISIEFPDNVFSNFPSRVIIPLTNPPVTLDSFYLTDIFTSKFLLFYWIILTKSYWSKLVIFLS